MTPNHHPSGVEPDYELWEDVEPKVAVPVEREWMTGDETRKMYSERHPEDEAHFFSDKDQERYWEEANRRLDGLNLVSTAAFRPRWYWRFWWWLTR